MRRVAALAAWCVLCLALCVALVARPHLADRWALFLGSPNAPDAARLYLDPFPDAVSCESRVRLFRANGEAAYCSDRRELAFGSAADDVLAADFRRLTGPYCAPRRNATRT